MSNNGEDIIRETFEKLGAAIGVQMQMPDEMIANLAARLQAQIDLLAELQSTGRLIPAGGHVLTAEEWANRITLADKQVAVSEAWEQGFEYGSGHKYGAEDDGVRLTAEQVEDVEALVATANPYSAPAVRLRALFPATEPAEERRRFPTIQDVPNNTLFHTHGGNGSSLFVRTHSGDLRLCLNAGREWSKLMQEEDFLPSSGPYVEVPWSKFPQPPADPFAQPAPAEPAEEETKAEGPCMGGGDMHPCVLSAGHAGVHTDSRGLRWNYPASSPVVPAPTEASVIGGAAVALRSAMALLDPHEGGDWEHAWRTIGDLADCASRAYAAAPTETGPRYCSSCKLNVPPAPYCTNCGGDTIPRSPTETGPWPSLLAVPVTVQKVKDAKGYEWHRRGSTDGWRGCNGADAYTSNCRTGHRDSAPFVAAEEG